MNVFIVLLTTVSAGQHPAPAPAAVAHPAPVASSCGGSCGAVSDCCVSDCCCEKVKKTRSRKCKGSCCEVVSCCPAPCAQPCSAPACQSSCAPACCAPAAPACCGAASCCQTSCCEPVCCEKPKRRCLFSRKKKDCCEATCCDSCAAPSCCGSAPVTAAAPVILTPAAPAAPIGTPALPGKAVEPIKKMPSSDANKGAYLAPLAPIVTPAGAKIETEAKNPFELARRYELSAPVHSTDFSKLTGQLSYVHADGGLWVLRYAPLSQEDANGGSVILARDRVMSNYQEGDIVTVEGRVISERGSTRLGGPLYQVREMRLVNRPSN